MSIRDQAPTKTTAATPPRWRQQPRQGRIAALRLLGIALVLAVSGPAFAAADPRDAMAAIDQRARADKVTLASAWLLALDLTPPTVAPLSADPRDSEKAEHARAEQVRMRLTVAGEMQRRLRATPADPAVQSQVLTLVGSTDANAFVSWWATYRPAK